MATNPKTGMMASESNQEVLAAAANPDTTFKGGVDLLWQTPARFAGVLTAFLFLVFPKVFLGLNTFFYRDYGVLAYPFVFHHRESFWRGEFPFWNALSNSGAPFMAQWGTMTLYPGSLLYLLLPMPWSLNLFSFGHLVLGGVGMYLLAHRWVGTRFAAAFAGFVYVFNGVTFACLLWPNYMVALAWLPFVLLWGERAWKEGGRWLVLAALASAFQLLAGVPEVVLFTWICAGTFWIRDLVISRNLRWKQSGRFGVIILLAAGLAAVQLLPFFDLLAHSQRDSGFATSKWAMPGWGWANLLLPMFHAFQTPEGTWFQFGQTFFATYYLGGLVLILGVWAAWKVRLSTVWILCALVVFALVMALGDNGHLYRWLREFVPIVGVGRYAVKFMVLAAIALPLLAAFAVAHLDRHGEKDKALFRSAGIVGIGAIVIGSLLLWVAKTYPFTYDQWPATYKNSVIRMLLWGGGFACLVAAFQCRNTLQRMVWRMALLAVLAIDIATHTPGQPPTLSKDIMVPGLWEEQNREKPPAPGEGRVMISPRAEAVLLRSPVTKHQDDFIGKRLALWSNLNLLEGAPKVNGSSTLQLREQRHVEDLLYKHTNHVATATGLIDFLGVSRMTSSASAVEWTNRPTRLPLITAGQRPAYANTNDTLAALVSADFNPRKTVYLEPEMQATVGNPAGGQCEVSATEVTANNITFMAQAGAPSLVVIAQSFYHPWRATVNGEPTPLLRANHAFQAVLVPPGRHQVVLKYVDQRFRMGLVITMVTLLVCGAMWRMPNPRGITGAK